MAHQCLQCGQSFADGSPELLKGCPQCQGTRFFYTQAPLAKQEREALMKEANKDIRAILEELVKGHGGPARPAYEDPVWSNEAREKWLQVDSRKLRAHEAGAFREVPSPAPLPAPATQVPAAANPAAPKAVSKVVTPKARHAHAPHYPHPTQQAPLPLVEDGPRPPGIPPGSPPSPAEAKPKEQKPEVVVVSAPGQYEIDVEQLLEKSPIVVRRDGVYVVHLPSVFAASAPAKR